MKCWASRRRLLFGWWRSCRPSCWPCLAPFGFTTGPVGVTKRKPLFSAAPNVDASDATTITQQAKPMSDGTGNGITPNAKRLLYGGFAAILAAGVGAAIRGGILANWGAEFGFTGQQLGDINGAGFTGFCFGIVIGGVVADKIGYGKLVIAAFLFHMLSAFVTFGATTGMAPDAAYSLLYWGTVIFAVANGNLR